MKLTPEQEAEIEARALEEAAELCEDKADLILSFVFLPLASGDTVQMDRAEQWKQAGAFIRQMAAAKRQEGSRTCAHTRHKCINDHPLYDRMECLDCGGRWDVEIPE